MARRKPPPSPLEPLYAPRKKQPPPLIVRLPLYMVEELTEIAHVEDKPRNAVIQTLLRYGLPTIEAAKQNERETKKAMRGLTATFLFLLPAAARATADPGTLNRCGYHVTGKNGCHCHQSGVELVSVSDGFDLTGRAAEVAHS